jgi:NAD(P)-dependent dehydrogenase (short-subunit alcohol dehydrogenase family)
MNGKLCLITGASSGIGKVAAIELAKRGASMVLVCRTAEKGRLTAEEIKGATGNRSIDFLAADLSSQAEIRKLAADYQSRFPAPQILINNAGLALKKRTLSPDGIEMTFAVNHLAYFLLTNLLLDPLKSNGPARIVNVSSDAHHSGAIDFEDLQFEKHYSAWKAYCRSKLCNLFFTYELAKRLQGTAVTVNALHPGAVATKIFRDVPAPLRALILLLTMSPQKGAQTTVYLASSPEVEDVSGKYFKKKAEAQSSAASRDAQVAGRLWEISAKMTGLS